MSQIQRIKERLLGRCPQRQSTVRMPLGYCCVGFERSMAHQLCHKTVLLDMIGLLQTFLHITKILIEPPADVLLCMIMNLGSPFLDRLLSIEDSWKGVILHPDQFEGLLSNILVDSRNGSHLITDEPHTVNG